jgi:excisionase family DNA binding protein
MDFIFFDFFSSGATLVTSKEIDMRSAHHPTSKAATAARGEPLLANPIAPLAEQVGKAVAAEVKHFKRQAASKLEAHITALIAEALDRSLSSATAQGKAIRMALIAKLASAEAGGELVAERPRAAVTDALLTTANAATRLEVSRSYVSMLCDQGKLGEVVTTEGGHRRIRSSAVDAYLSTRTKQHEGAKSPREAALEAGLYDFPEGHFKNIVRGNPDAAARTAKVPVKAARKPRL